MPPAKAAPATPVAAMTRGLDGQSKEMTSMATAPTMKLKNVNRDEAVPVSLSTCSSTTWLLMGRLRPRKSE